MRSGFKTSLLFLQLLLCTKDEFLVINTLMSLQIKAVLSLNVSWQGNSKPLPCVVDLFRVPRHSGLFSAFVWLNFFLQNLCFLLHNKLFIPSNWAYGKVGNGNGNGNRNGKLK